MVLADGRVKIERKRKGTLTTMPRPAYEAMNAAAPRGCPFRNYSFYDLLGDLVAMHDWKLEMDRVYSLGEFLAACNDEKADIYRKDFLRMEMPV